MRSAPGGKANDSMSTKIRYTDAPLGKLKVVPDFLPPPEDLVFRDEGVKITMSSTGFRRRYFVPVATTCRTRRADQAPDFRTDLQESCSVSLQVSKILEWRRSMKR